MANLIKADLQDALTNDSRWKVEGLQHYFHDYQNWQSWIIADTQNEEIKKELEKNRIRNYNKRRDDDDKQSSEMIFPDELEPADYQEILNLISQIRPLKEKKDQQKRREVYQKLNNRKIYWDGGGKRKSAIVGKGKYYSFRAKENGQEYFLEIAANHPILNNFSFDNEGFYWITGTENIPLEREGNYFSKCVELGDEITLTPFNP